MYTHFNVQNICLNNLLVCLLFNFENVRWIISLKFVTGDVYGRFQNRKEGIPINYLNRYFVH
jgi:hypothetical protein